MKQTVLIRINRLPVATIARSRPIADEKSSISAAMFLFPNMAHNMAVIFRTRYCVPILINGLINTASTEKIP